MGVLSHSAISVFPDVGVITEAKVKTEQGCSAGRYLKANTLIFWREEAGIRTSGHRLEFANQPVE